MASFLFRKCGEANGEQDNQKKRRRKNYTSDDDITSKRRRNERAGNRFALCMICGAARSRIHGKYGVCEAPPGLRPRTDA